MLQQNAALTFNLQNEAFFDGHPKRLMGNAAYVFSFIVPGGGLEVEEGWHRVRLVQVVFVAGKQDVWQHFGERKTNALTRRVGVLLIPHDVHVQRIVALCLTDDFVLAPFLQDQGGAHVQGDTGRLWVEKGQTQILTCKYCKHKYKWKT